MKKFSILLCAVLFAGAAYAAFEPDINAINDGVKANQGAKTAVKRAVAASKKYPAKEESKEMSDETMGQLVQNLDHMEQFTPYFDDACAFLKDDRVQLACYGGVFNLQRLIEQMRNERMDKEFKTLYIRYDKLWWSYQRMLYMLYDKYCFPADEDYIIFQLAVQEHDKLLIQIGEIAGIIQPDNLTADNK
ncbi:MAG: hypothetical protein LBI01_03700 [Elusimicrobium sp.]|jgi:hypothetical protein|nr:hypothetical protein [Elusimicrobium sp.]